MASTGSSSSPRPRSTPATTGGPRPCWTTRSSPTPTTARPARCYADTLEQLGYGAENGTWRNFFLSGATELREGNFGTPAVTAAPAVLAQLTPEQLFDSLAISVNGPKAWDLDLSLDVDVHRSRARTTGSPSATACSSTASDRPTTRRGCDRDVTKARMLGLLGGRHLESRASTSPATRLS